MFHVKRCLTSMTNKSETGKMGEDIACEFLKNKGYKIIARNFRQKWGELDIVATAKDKTLVFVEVKTLRQTQDKQSGNSANDGEPSRTIAGLPAVGQTELQPEDNLTKSKLKKLKRIAQLYAGYNQNLIDENKGWRIDLVAITMFADKHPQINHYENIS